MRALIVLSGGLDSTTALALAKEQGHELLATAFAYGQRHQAAELHAASEVADYYNVPFQVFKIPVFQGDSVLMTDREMPHATYEELHAAVGPSPTYVPFRNGTFLSIAAGLALDRECDTVWIGTHAEDAHNFAYPDCTPEFIGAMQNAIYVGTYHKVRVVAPFTYKSKAEVVRVGLDLNVPYRLTHSCYEGMRPACGVCPTCIGRLEAFTANGSSDPLDYNFDRYRRRNG